MVADTITFPTRSAVQAVLTDESTAAQVAWHGAREHVRTICVTAMHDKAAAESYLHAAVSSGWAPDTVDIVALPLRRAVEAARGESEYGPHEHTGDLYAFYGGAPIGGNALGYQCHAWSADLARAAALIWCGVAGMVDPEDWVQDLVMEFDAADIHDPVIRWPDEDRPGELAQRVSGYLKLGDIRAALEASLDRPVSRQLADKYTRRKDFPAPTISEPVRLWDSRAIEDWIAKIRE